MKLWLKLSPKVREQVLRAGRLFVAAWLALIAPVLNGTVPVSWGFICSTVVAAVEVVFRSLVPVTPTKAPVVAPVAPNENQAGYAGNELLIGLAAIVVIIAGVLWILNSTGH